MIDQIKLELALTSVEPITVGEDMLLGAAVDYYNGLLDQCGDHDEDVVGHIINQLNRIIARCEVSITLKTRGHLRLAG